MVFLSRLLGRLKAGTAFEEGAVRWRRLYFSALFGVFDQGIASLANLGAGLLVIRTSTKDNYGLYSIGYMLVMLSIGISGALFSGQAVVAYYDKPRERRAGYVASMLLGQLIIVVPLCALLIAILALGIRMELIDPQVGTVLMLAALVAPPAMTHDFMRSYFYIETVRYAALISAVHCICWLGFSWSLYKLGFAASNITLLGYGVATSVSATVSLLLARLPLFSSFAMTIRSMRDAWLHGKWAVMGTLISAVQNQSQVYLLGVMAGPAQVANVNATRLLFGPLTMLLSGVNSILLPRLVELRSTRSYGEAMKLTYKFILLIFPMVACYAILLYSIIDFLSDTVLRKRFDNVHALIAAWAVSFILTTFSSAFSSQMIAGKRFRLLMILNLTTAVAVVGIDALLIPRLAALGSMIGLVGGQLAFIFLLYRAVVAAHRNDERTDQVPVV